MRATSLSLFALLAASPVFAADYLTYAPAKAVTVHPIGARVMHRATVEVAAGAHRLQIALPEELGNAAFNGGLPVDLSGEGLSRGPVQMSVSRALDPDTLLTPVQAAAKVRVDAASRALRSAEDAINDLMAEQQGLDAQIAYLSALDQGESANAEALTALARSVAAEITAARRQKVALDTQMIDLEEDKEEAQRALAAARETYAALAPFPASGPATLITIDIDKASAGPVQIEFESRIKTAGWTMLYDMALDTKTSALTVDRKVVVMQDSELGWKDVDLTLSTSELFTALERREVYGDKAAFLEPEKPMLSRSVAPMALEDSGMGRLAEPAVEPEVIVETSSSFTGRVDTTGPVVTYGFDAPLSLVSGGVSMLDLDQVTLEAAPRIEASPRWDDTAFLMAKITNTSGAPLLAGMANITRDGAFMGSTEIDRIPAGGSETLGFGPVEGIRLDTIFVRNETGDTGLIAKSSTRTQKIRFTVENITGEAQELRAFFPITFSEQEDLRVKVAASPQPTETDIDDRRGVSAWDMSLAPGEVKAVEMNVTLDWPEGSDLRWNP